MSQTLFVVARVFGVDMPQADDAEAAAIAAPAARMLDRNLPAQKFIRKVSDPVVLTGALGAFFASRTVLRRAPSAQPQQMRPVPTVATAPAGPSMTVGAETLQQRPVPPAPAAVAASTNVLHDSVMESIARQGFGALE